MAKEGHILSDRPVAGGCALGFMLGGFWGALVGAIALSVTGGLVLGWLGAIGGAGVGVAIGNAISPAADAWAAARSGESRWAAFGPPIAIECKWSASGFEARNLRAFRYHYPEGENWLVATDVDRPHRRTVDDIEVEFIGIGDMMSRLG